MHFYFKQLRRFTLAIVTCLVLLGLSLSGPISSSSKTLGTQPAQASHPITTADAQFSLLAASQANLKSAESVLIAQGASSLMSYVALMDEDNVVPNEPKTDRARGTVGAVLSGNRLVVRGSFKMLSSSMRNYATDPVNPPNTNITSAFHIHQGSMMENGPFQYALDVTLDDTGRGGSATGDYMLTPEQMQALSSGRLYVDIHTTKNRGGELRGVLMPY